MKPTTYNNLVENSIVCLLLLSGDMLRIFNRWGALLYESQNYQNNCNGSSQGNTHGKVPTGTYYYLVTLKKVD